MIQAAKNLMEAVVLTVKASYVASRMYRQQVGEQVSHGTSVLSRPTVTPCVHPRLKWSGR